jgi:AraC-like DNA-binding protein
MESFFFGVDLERYRDRLLRSGLQRVDVSGGLVYLATRGVISAHLSQHDIDRMIMIVFVRRGSVILEGPSVHVRCAEGEIALMTSRRQEWTVRFDRADAFVLYVADFFLKRYVRSDRPGGVIERLYAMIEAGGRLQTVSIQPLDALSQYLIDRIVEAPDDEPMRAMRGEHRVMELMMHRFGMLGLVPEGLDPETLETAARAKAILEASFVDPPTIEQLAKRCATNATRLKSVFKRVHQTTIYGYIQRLRMEEANLLLRQERLSIGEVARRVGYRHQGHFSRVFYETYGIYPKTLK